MVTGELLGDQHINYKPITPNIIGRFLFTLSAMPYIRYLNYNALASVTNKYKPTAGSIL